MATAGEKTITTSSKNDGDGDSNGKEAPGKRIVAAAAAGGAAAVAAMVAAAVAAAMAVGRERPELRRLGLHVCR